MKYVLGVGFIVEKYRRNPNVRIFIDDMLVDDFDASTSQCLEKISHVPTIHYEPSGMACHAEISEDDFKIIIKKIQVLVLNKAPAERISEIIVALTPSTITRMKDFLRNASGIELGARFREVPVIKDWLSALDVQRIPKHFKLYQIDEQNLKGKKQVSLRIENEDSNATNGFLTRSTLIDLRNIFLIPMPYIDLFKGKGEKFWENMKSVIPADYHGIGQVMFNKYHSASYPFPFRYMWNGKETFDHGVGGNGTLVIDLICKNNLVMFDPSLSDKRYLDQDIKDWIKDYIHKHPDEEHLKFNGISRSQAIEIVEEKKDYEVFSFSRPFISLVNQGVFDKYLKDEN